MFLDLNVKSNVPSILYLSLYYLKMVKPAETYCDTKYWQRDASVVIDVLLLYNVLSQQDMQNKG